MIALFRCGGEPADGGFCVFRYLLALEQQFSQAVLGKLVPKFRGVCEPFQCDRRVTLQGCVTGKIQLTKSKGGEAVFLRCRKCEQSHRLLNVFFHALTIPIDFAERVLSTVLAGFRRLCQPLQCLGCLLRCRGWIIENHPGQLVLRMGIVQFGRLFKPCPGCRLIFTSPHTMEEHPSDAVLQFIVMALLLQFEKSGEGLPVPLFRRFGVLLTANAVPIHLS